MDLLNESIEPSGTTPPKRRPSLRARRHARSGLRVCALAAVLVLSSGANAMAGSTVLSFFYPDVSQVAEFRALIGFGSGNYEHEVSLGIPAAVGQVYSASITIPDDLDVYVAVVVVDKQGLRSPPSNERVRRASTPTLGAPGQPVVDPY